MRFQVNQDTPPDQPPQLLAPAQLRQLQTDTPVHICPSQSEGWGHTINEARAVGALVLTTDYPPMNEFVSK
jgi:glycosyltransferase involved in cell wall biosynthesis